MSKQTLYILGILAVLILGAFLYPNKCCSDCYKKKSEQSITLLKQNPKTIIYKAFKINGKDFNYSCSSNFQFLPNGFNNIQPVSDSINNGILLLKKHFEKKPRIKLSITGYAAQNEKNTSAFPNLGMARANDVKNYFVSKGFSASRFEINGEIDKIWKSIHDTIIGAVQFEIKPYDNVNSPYTENWNILKEKITKDLLILYFSVNQRDINLSVDERQKIAVLSKYIDNVPNAKIICIGHTDSSGDRNVNMELGQERADFVKEYLIQNGIPENKIESSSKGPDEPVSDNITPEGKAENRRTVVSLK